MQPSVLGERFPPAFRFGAATAAPMVEGATGRRGRHVWDAYAAVPGNIIDGSTPEVACDHVDRYVEDLDLLRRLGAQTYRFSVSWSRVQREGRGAVDEAGLDFYDRLVDGLLERGIEPTVVLHHWDLPQALEDTGGWLDRDTVERFADYAGILGRRLGDRVAHWVPIHHPMSISIRGYGLGEQAPGRRLLFGGLHSAHHLMLAHGRAVAELRSTGARSIGTSNDHSPVWPASLDDADLAASKLFHSIWNAVPLESMLLGRYPEDLMPVIGNAIRPGDMEAIAQPLDFYGMSYTGPNRIMAAPADSPVPIRSAEIGGHPRTDNGPAVVPVALADWLVSVSERYAAVLPPLVVTGCGAAYSDLPDAGGVIHDDRRIEYLAGHIGAVADAIAAGVDVRGFYVWSLLDGWEWDDGLVTGHGLVHVDHATQERTPKASFEWFRELLLGHRAART